MTQKIQYKCTCGAVHAVQMMYCNKCGNYNCITPVHLSKPEKTLNKLSHKEVVQKRKLHKLYAEIDAEAMTVENLKCWGCGMDCGVLSHSHLLSVGQFKKYELTKQNIWLMGCGNYDSCHDRWESGDIERMVLIPTFWECLEIVKSLNKGHYNSLVVKLNASGLNKYQVDYY